MKICDDHMCLGAALIQVAEHARFTSINSLSLPSGEALQNLFLVNKKAALYLKYSRVVRQSYDEHPFSFSRERIRDLYSVAAAKRSRKLWLGLVCLGDTREICCLDVSDLASMVTAAELAGAPDDAQVTVLVRARKGRWLHVYLNDPVKNAAIVGDLRIPRNAFPDRLFAD